MFEIPVWAVGVGFIDGMRQRLAEVEERLDFAECLLTKQREAERIVPPQS